MLVCGQLNQAFISDCLLASNECTNFLYCRAVARLFIWVGSFSGPFGVHTQNANHAEAKGVWGHAPPGNVLKLYTKRLNLVAFQSIKIKNFIVSCRPAVWMISRKISPLLL